MKKALGKGLGSLIPEESKPERQIEEVAIKDLSPNKYQMRTDFADEKLNELAVSLKEHGVVQPIIAAKKGKKYMIIAGERRWRAAKLAGFSSIPCIIKKLDDSQSLLVSLIENIQRENLSVIEEAAAYEQMSNEFSMTQQDIALKVGKSRSTVANLMRLLTLPDDLIELVGQNKISAGHARAILSVDDENKRRYIADKILKEKLTVREAEKIASVSTESGRSKLVAKTKAKTLDPEIKKIEGRLEKILGTKVYIKTRRGGKGLLSIEYYSVSDFERIIGLICGK